jgi:hypothetical protein
VVPRFTLVSFTDFTKDQTLTPLKSHKRDGIRMVSSCRPTGIPGLPLMRCSADSTSAGPARAWGPHSYASIGDNTTSRSLKGNTAEVLMRLNIPQS